MEVRILIIEKNGEIARKHLMYVTYGMEGVQIKCHIVDTPQEGLDLVLVRGWRPDTIVVCHKSLNYAKGMEKLRQTAGHRLKLVA